MHLLDELIGYYEPMGVTWHPVLFKDENVVTFDKPWIEPFILDHSQDGFEGFIDKGYHKKNEFIRLADIEDEDYYCILDDDDMAELGVFTKIAQMDDDCVVVSMKRGFHTPADVAPARRYPTTTLIAAPENMQVGDVSGQQYITKGRIFRQLHFQENYHCADGAVAVWLKERFQIRYEPDLYVLFNYFEKERWATRKIAFGALVNDMMRLDMCLKQSDLPGTVTIVLNPESSTVGLNKILFIMQAEGADVGVLVHQDMYFRQGWLQQVEEQLSLLPPDWIVAGIIGKDLEGNICGTFHDMRIAPVFNTSDIHTFPHPAACFDECCIIVNLKSGFRFDEALEGFDLYGTLAVLQAWEMGGSAWIIDAFAEHYCMRPFTWFPDKDFQARFKWLHERFPNALKIDSTVLGVPNKNEKAA
jgi:hypothetical protein